jgi:hypothetical protein
VTSKSKTNSKKEPTKTTEPTYEDKAVHLGRQLIEQLCRHIPELRSAVLVFDWRDRLPEISVPAIFWTGDGPPNAGDPAYVAGLLSQLNRVFQMETSLAMQCLAEFDRLIKDGREKMIHESGLSATEKEALLRQIGRERPEVRGEGEQPEAT